MTQQQVLELLGAALASIDGSFTRRNRVERFKDEPLGTVLSELSRMERETTSASSVRLIAMAKQVLSGKTAPDAYVERCNNVIGAQTP